MISNAFGSRQFEKWQKPCDYFYCRKESSNRFENWPQYNTIHSIIETIYHETKGEREKTNSPVTSAFNQFAFTANRLLIITSSSNSVNSPKWQFTTNFGLVFDSSSYNQPIRGFRFTVQLLVSTAKKIIFFYTIINWTIRFPIRNGHTYFQVWTRKKK